MVVVVVGIGVVVLLRYLSSAIRILQLWATETAPIPKRVEIAPRIVLPAVMIPKKAKSNPDVDTKFAWASDISRSFNVVKPLSKSDAIVSSEMTCEFFAAISRRGKLTPLGIF